MHGVRRRGFGPAGYSAPIGGLDPLAVAFFANVAANGGVITAPRKPVYNAFLAGLRARGLLDVLDRWWWSRAASPAIAQVDLIAGAHARIIGAPAFVADAGWTCAHPDGVAADLAWTDIGGHYQMNGAGVGASVGIWLETQGAADHYVLGGRQVSPFKQYWFGGSDTACEMSFDSGGETTAVKAAPAGFFACTRHGSGEGGIYQDGVPLGSAGFANDLAFTKPIGLGCWIVYADPADTVGVVNEGTYQWSAAFLGGAMDDGQMAALYALASAFRTNLAAA